VSKRLEEDRADAEVRVAVSHFCGRHTRPHGSRYARGRWGLAERDRWVEGPTSHRCAGVCGLCRRGA